MGTENRPLAYVVMYPPQYSPQKEQRSNGGADPSFSGNTMRVMSRRNLRRKIKPYSLLMYTNLEQQQTAKA